MLIVYFICAAAVAAGAGAQLAFCNRSSSSARARARRRSATWGGPKTKTPLPRATGASAFHLWPRAAPGHAAPMRRHALMFMCMHKYRWHMHARLPPTVCHLPRHLRIVGGDGGQGRCGVGVAEAIRRRRRACGGTEARLRDGHHTTPHHTTP